MAMTKHDRRLATLAQALYLTNITILPLFSFVILVFMYKKNFAKMHATAVLHCRQAIFANIIAGILLIAVSGLIFLTGSFDSPYMWMILIIYFLSIHSVLILYGVFALIKAHNEEDYVYPVFGKLWQ
jgi:uncharacterized Tic20 family protein